MASSATGFYYIYNIWHEFFPMEPASNPITERLAVTITAMPLLRHGAPQMTSGYYNSQDSHLGETSMPFLL